MPLPLVTVAIPTYKRLSFLKIAVGAALVQSYPHVEILISQDPTPNGLDPDICAWSKAMANRHARVRYQANLQNRGLAGNWNVAADHASGDYIVIIGDDDVLLPNFVSTLIREARSSPEVVFSNHYLINSEGSRLLEDSQQWTWRYNRGHMSPGSLDHPEICVWQNAIPLLSALIKTKTVRRLRFKENLNTPEIELFLRLAQEKGDFVFVPEYLAEYRIHSQSATSSGRGLRSDRLVDSLLPITVSSQVEPYKHTFLSRRIVNAVSHCLLDGCKLSAKNLIQSSYYPASRIPRLDCAIQRVCVVLPGYSGINLYKKLYAAKKLFR